MHKQEKKYYTDEINHQILISLLKQSGIKRVIASPGATNVSFVGSLQNDPFFEMYSCVDERSAAFMACGMAAETGEPVVLSCTGATSSRNYVSAMTKAFYDKLPVLAVTSTQDARRVGHMIAQVTDRKLKPSDSCVHAEYIPSCSDETSIWDATIRINRCLLALKHRGGGPVHINLATTYSRNFSVKKLPLAHLIRRATIYDNFPEMPHGRVAVFVGSHVKWTDGLTDAIDRFCTKYGAVVWGGYCSNLTSRFSVSNGLIAAQDKYHPSIFRSDLLIHIGEVSGDYANMGRVGGNAKKVWRVSKDGELRDQFRKLTRVFEMSEEDFFTHYANGCDKVAETNAYLETCRQEYERVMSKMVEMPFSNLWIAQKSLSEIPEGSVLHLGILNSLRAWGMFEKPKNVSTYVNSGGFGIDGVMSSCIGGAIAQQDNLHFLVIGDLAFFYDMNSLLNAHFPANMRILLINNGKGVEFRNYNHHAAIFGDDADKYMAAAGHFGNKSDTFVRHLTENCGYEYLSATNKEEYTKNALKFFNRGGVKKPILFEVFTTDEDESDALRIIKHLERDKCYWFYNVAYKLARKILPPKVMDILKGKVRRIIH